MRLFQVIGLFFLTPFCFGQTLNLSVQGIKDFKTPGKIQYEAIGSMPWCYDAGYSPMPYYSPKKLEVSPKIITQTEDSAIIEVSLKLIKANNCTYRFKSFSLWTKQYAGYLSVERAEPRHAQLKDYDQLEINQNPSAQYEQICQMTMGLYKCFMSRDGMALGHKNSNGAHLYIKLNKLRDDDVLESEVTLNLTN